MTRIAITGSGAVSPAGWGIAPLHQAAVAGIPLEALPVPSLPGKRAFDGFRVPPPTGRPPYGRHPRLRRASPIARYALAAGLEALGPARAAAIADGTLDCGVIFTVMNACVTYSARFFGEVLDNPASASPILFPETVFNAPSSHVSAFLGSHAPNDTLVGDEATYLVGLDLAAQWLIDRQVDACLVIGAEELDWVTAEGNRACRAAAPAAEGAGALVLERSEDPQVELAQTTDALPYLPSREGAIASVEAQLPPAPDIDLAPLMGNAMGAAAALRCVAAIARGSDARIVVAGSNQQAAGAHIRFH